MTYSRSTKSAHVAAELAALHFPKNGGLVTHCRGMCEHSAACTADEQVQHALTRRPRSGRQHEALVYNPAWSLVMVRMRCGE